MPFISIVCIVQSAFCIHLLACHLLFGPHAGTSRWEYRRAKSTTKQRWEFISIVKSDRFSSCESSFLSPALCVIPHLLMVVLGVRLVPVFDSGANLSSIVLGRFLWLWSTHTSSSSVRHLYEMLMMIFGPLLCVCVCVYYCDRIQLENKLFDSKMENWIDVYSISHIRNQI